MQAAVEKLRRYRDENVRSHDEVIEIWTKILSQRKLSPFGDEKWLILEQVFKSALHCAQNPIAYECLDQLSKQFKPTSRRLQVLKAMYYESTDKYDEAKDVYDSLLKEDETDAIVRKRLISLFKQQKQIRQAIEQLNVHLELYQADQEAWAELCELYLSEHDYVKAMFCAEELLLFNPHNHLNHERYASICYTNGNYEKARTYYFSAIKLNPENLRALYGIVLTSANMKTKSSSENNKLIIEQILENYKTTMPELLSIVETTLQNFITEK